MKTNKKLFSVGLLACLIGLAGLIPSFYFWYQTKQITHVAAQGAGETVTKPTVVQAPAVVTGKPAQLVIPSLNLNLYIEDGVFNPRTGQWTLSNNNVHYALITVQPNDKQGNTLIYGHYRPGVFSTLKSIKPGELVEVRTENGLVFTYRFTSSQVVSPADGSIFDYTGKPMLTLQTCTGTFMQNRQFFHFDFVSVSKVN